MSNPRKRGRSTRQADAHTQAILEAQATGWRCWWCGTPLTEDTITADHVVPMHAGGSDRRPNIVPACAPCNNLRGIEDTSHILTCCGGTGSHKKGCSKRV